MKEGKKILMVIANSDFNDTEYAVPRKIFEDNGIEVTVASITKGRCLGSKDTVVESDLSIDDVDPEQFDAIVYVGGDGAETLFYSDRALRLAKDFNYPGKPVGAICIAPVILAKAGLLTGKKATVCASNEKELDMVDATYTAEKVTVDGNIVTANGPEAAGEFAEKIVDLL